MISACHESSSCQARETGVRFPDGELFVLSCVPQQRHALLLLKDVFGSIVLVVVEKVRLAEFAVLMPTR